MNVRREGKEITVKRTWAYIPQHEDRKATVQQKDTRGDETDITGMTGVIRSEKVA
jgi:hypothetical protein